MAETPPAATSNRFVPRAAQARILGYQRGRLGISAVPGSGKTQTLSHLAARLVRELTENGALATVGSGALESQEVLIVTFSNSGVENFRNRIGRILREEYDLLPGVGYRVRTLHALANDIVRMRPALVGLADDFLIADERTAGQVLDEALHHQLTLAPDALNPYLSANVDDRRVMWIKRERWPDLARDLTATFIRRAKDMELTPADLRARLGTLEGAVDTLLRLGLDVFEAYQRGLQVRNMVDFDDLIRLALLALRLDADFLQRLRRRWPFILEDEAQDSSELQEKMLRLLTNTGDDLPVPPAAGAPLLANDGNWVRVGDPNQAINTTFTTADPIHLRRFLTEPGSIRHDLPDSGRSARPIIDLANYLVDWTATSHPEPWLRQHAFLRQSIRPTPPGDPQPNPTASFSYLDDRMHSPDEELLLVADSLQRWLPGHRDQTVAVLVPENERGYKLAEVLKFRQIEHELLLRSTAATRNVSHKLERVVRFLAAPDQRPVLADVYEHVWWPRGPNQPPGAQPPAETGTQTVHEPAPAYEAEAAEEAAAAPAPGGPLPLSPLPYALAQDVSRDLRRVSNVEDFLYPGPSIDWLANYPLATDQPDVATDLANFRAAVRRWLEGIVLPIDQLVLTLGNELFTEATDLALTHKLAIVLAGLASVDRNLRLAELADELAKIANNERRFLGFDTADLGYEPRRGTVTIATMHQAKGLEWDRVYLMALNNYSFPSGQPHDSFRAEPWFVRNELNLEAETLARLEALLAGQPAQYREGEASRQARLAYAAERLRLFYVAITRARQDLIITWNYGRFGDQDSAKRNVAATPLLVLHEYWRTRWKDKNTR